MSKTKAPRTHKTPKGAAGPQRPQVHELLYQALETERGGVEVYTTAIECTVNAELRKEWQKYLKQTTQHVETVEDICRKLGLDPEEQTAGRRVVHAIGAALVQAMRSALGSGDKAAAEIVAAECVTLAETKDHLNWELIGEIVKSADSELSGALRKAHEKIEEEEDEHLYHSQGWARELWIKSFGLPAVLPPPEEKHDVKTATAAEKAKKGRTKEARASKEAAA
ncbi:MAG TPA: hypothetical protein VFY71_02630 [Planctomycetota bacterium]|nr:hypothetical protein [Planctomycetota bacterium]